MTPGMISHEEQLDMWRRKLDAWYTMLDLAHLPKPAEPPPFVWDTLHGEALLRDAEARDTGLSELHDKAALGQLAARLGGEAKGGVSTGGGYFGALQTAAEMSAKQASAQMARESRSGLGGQPPAPIDQPDAHHSAATQAAVQLLRGVVRHLRDLRYEATRSDADNVVRALELLGVKP